MSVDYLLHESSLGYAIFKVAMQPDTIGNRLKEVQQHAGDLAHFGKMVQLVSFAPFRGAAEALENANDISEGIVSDYLHTVIEANLPKPSKSSSKVSLGVADKTLASGIKAAFPGIECQTADSSELAGDLLRGLRTHSEKVLKQVQTGDVERAQLGLGHSYSRAKVKFSVNRNDNHIIQAIATLDHLDKAVNTFSMRVREWYSWHFPELVRIVSENLAYARLALFIGDKKTLSDDRLHDLAALVNDDAAIAQSILDASKISMGQDISASDMENVMAFASRCVKLAEYRKSLSAYLVAKMGVVAPNLAALIGETVGARLISHAGSLTTLAKYPASTVQILGAEKALFRALKTKGNTPKYGLIYHSSFIGKAGIKNKGRISRFLANKCSIASRIDNFSETPDTRFGEALKKQVEERLEFYASGAVPMKNETAMKNVIDSVRMDSVLSSINVDSKSKIVPAVSTEMEGVIPAPSSANPAQGDEKAAKKLRKEEKRRLKELKKVAKKSDKPLAGADASDDINDSINRSFLETEGADVAMAKKIKKEQKRKAEALSASGAMDIDTDKAEKKKRKKHKHGKE